MTIRPHEVPSRTSVLFIPETVHWHGRVANPGVESATRPWGSRREGILPGSRPHRLPGYCQRLRPVSRIGEEPRCWNALLGRSAAAEVSGICSSGPPRCPLSSLGASGQVNGNVLPTGWRAWRTKRHQCASSLTSPPLSTCSSQAPPGPCPLPGTAGQQPCQAEAGAVAGVLQQGAGGAGDEARPHARRHDRRYERRDHGGRHSSALPSPLPGESGTGSPH